MTKKKMRTRRFLSFVCILTMLLPIIIPTDITYASVIQNQGQATLNSTNEEVYDCGTLQSDANVDEDICVLDDGLTVFDTWKQNASAAALDVENAPTEKQKVNEIVIFIRFADQSENIYDTYGGYDYIESMFNGDSKSLKDYVDEYSWGQVDATTYFWPQNADGTPVCYVDEHPVSYYLKQTTNNPNGYTATEKSSRRSTLLKNALNSVGTDYLETLGIENEPYNLVFMVSGRGSWNDLLWSHKSSITINGQSTVYNMLTYTSKSDISRTITHEFMHSLGYKDMYRYYTDTSANPVSLWSIMGSTSATVGHPLVYEKNKYGKWLGDTKAIKTINKSGHYEIDPSTADPDEHTLAYKIPVEGQTNQYFMIEYRGSASSGYDTALNREGLIFYRVQANKSGNGYGPPDEVYVLREDKITVANSYYDGTDGKTSFSAFTLYDDTTDLGISVYNIKKEDGYMSFDIEVPYVELEVSKASPISVADSAELTLSTVSLGEGNHTYRFGILVGSTEYELSGGYQSKNSVTVNLLDILKTKVAGTHTLFVDVKNGTTGTVKRGTISDYTINGVNVSQLTTDLASPQKVGATIQLSATVENEAVSTKNTYQFVVENNGEKEALTMSGNYKASWTPEKAGIYTIKYTVTDGYGLTAEKEIQYPIGSDTTAYVFYKNSSWSKAYIHYQIGTGAWTKSPGVQMISSNVDGYSWVYLLEVGNKTATAAFNNGNSTWDNNNKNDYTIKAGVNSIGGKSLTLSSVGISTDCVEKKKCEFTVSIKGGIAPYICDYTIKEKESNRVVEEKTGVNLTAGTYEISSGLEDVGEYVLSVTVKDSYGQTKSQQTTFDLGKFTISGIKTSLSTPQLSGTEITLTEVRKNAYISGSGVRSEWTIQNKTTGSVVEEVVSDSETLKWTPTEIGEYEITVKTTDSAGETATCTIAYSIVEKIINRAIIYYANSSWSAANIHYMIGDGEWTKVPGVAMEKNSEQSGYTWMYVIELGEETEATICFNNGNDSWDSRDELNYSVGVGTYGVKNGVVTELIPIVTPIITATPIVTDEPVVTTAPAITTGPAVTTAPAITPTPVVTTAPAVSIEPTITATMVVTMTPVPTEIPTSTPVLSISTAPTMTPDVTQAPTNTPIITQTPIVSSGPAIAPTESVTATPKPTDKTSNVNTPTTLDGEVITETPKKGTIVVDSKTKAQYKVISNGTTKTVSYVKSTSKATSVTIPDTIKIDRDAYKIKEISANAFKNNKKIKVFTIGKYVTTIGKSAFYGCTSLQKVKKGANVQKIGDKAFYGCKKLTSISMSAKLTTIGKSAFYKCTALKKITLPSKVKKIGSKAFYGCKNLKNITIKTKKLTSKNVGSSAWKGLSAKATIKVPGSKLKAYKKLLKSKGIGAKVKVKK